MVREVGQTCGVDSWLVREVIVWSRQCMYKVSVAGGEGG